MPLATKPRTFSCKYNAIHSIQKSPTEGYENFLKASEYFVYNPSMTLPRFAIVTSASLARSLSLVSGSISVFKKVRVYKLTQQTVTNNNICLN